MLQTTESFHFICFLKENREENMKKERKKEKREEDNIAQ